MSEMKKEIQKIINDPQLGPYQLEFVYNKLTDDKQRQEFMTVLKNLILEGSEKEKTASFTVIEMMDKAKEIENIIKQNIDNLTFSESQSLINSLLWLAANISKGWGIDFIKNVIQHFKPKNKEHSYLFNMGIRCIVSTQHWKEVITEIDIFLLYCDEITLVDFLTYFKWKRGKNDLKELIQLLNVVLIERISLVQKKIELRLNSHYMAIK